MDADTPSAADAAAAEFSRRARWLVFVIVWLLLFLLLFGLGSCGFYGYHFGTPTTATVTYCGSRNSCIGAWTVDGVRHTGSIHHTARDLAVGRPIDVHVRGDTAYTADEGTPGLLIAAGVVGVIGVVIILVRRRKDRSTPKSNETK
jgi:hypothetical protein